MRLRRLGKAGSEIPVLIDGERVLDLRGVVDDLVGEALAPGGLERIRAAAGSLPELAEASGMRVGPPVGKPTAIVCIGQNYAAHAAESGSPPPEWPIVFFKTPAAISGPYDELVIPPGSSTTDWEVELGVVIGTRAWQLGSREESRAHIAGYLLADDVSERTWQRDESGGQWGKGKSAPGFCPLGPDLVTADEVDPADLRLQSWVNGEPRQDSSTADLVFDVDHLIHHLSHYLPLEPGDLVLTGTPQGVAMSGNFPYLKPGDTLEMEIEGLGRQRQQVVGA